MAGAAQADAAVSNSAATATADPHATRPNAREQDKISPFPERPYTQFVGGDEAECRWGDYSASFALPNGDVWSATEFIGDNGRTTFGNWSTFVWPVTP